MNKRIFFRNAFCLTVSAFLMRLINILYRIYLTDKIGAEGMGLYQLIYSVFIFAITVSTAGISLSVTRIISTAISSGKQNTIGSCIRKCILFSLCMSIGAAVLLICSAGMIGNGILGDSRVILSLQILAIGLPFMAICACMKGYFLAVRGVIRSAIGELLEQLVTISVSVSLFILAAPSTVEHCCCVVVIGSTAGEIASCLSTYFLYRLHLRKCKIRHYEKSSGIFNQICRIALPITASSALRSGLGVVENLLIPIGYRKNGVSSASALAEYGILNGMVIPVLFFPSTFLISFASLLVPEMTEALTLHRQKYIQSVAERAIRITLIFSIYTAIFIGCFADSIGILLYKNTESVRLLQILAPLIPLWYLDIVVDNLLKGLDQQMASMRYNFLDTAIRVVLVYFMIPIAGTKGYIGILFFSTIFNATLSIRRLIQTASLHIFIKSWILIPLLSAGSTILLCLLFVRQIPFIQNSLWAKPLCVLCLSCGAYLCILSFYGSIQKNPLIRLKKHLQKIKKDSPERLPDS